MGLFGKKKKGTPPPCCGRTPETAVRVGADKTAASVKVLGFKDTWTCLAPWNALAVGLTDSDTCNQVNMGNTTFSDTYGPSALLHQRQEE